MKIKTSKQKTYDVEWIDVASSGKLYLEMKDGRRLPAVAADFDGLSVIERVDENQGNKVFEGYTALESIHRTEDNVITIALGKEG